MKEVILHSLKNKKNSITSNNNQTIISNGNREHLPTPSNPGKSPSNTNPLRNASPFPGLGNGNGVHGNSDHSNGNPGNFTNYQSPVSKIVINGTHEKKEMATDSFDNIVPPPPPPPSQKSNGGRVSSSKRKERLKAARKQLQNDIACMKLQLTESQMK